MGSMMGCRTDARYRILEGLLPGEMDLAGSTQPIDREEDLIEGEMAEMSDHVLHLHDVPLIEILE
jgi:hypothetical protein